MTLTQLEYIVAVAREKNFHRAAKTCHVTQPTLSTMVKNLEEELGIVLFDRSKSPTVPTLAGQDVVNQAKVVLTEMHKIPELINNQKGEIKGDLKVGIIPTIGPYLLHLFLKRFREKYPLINLSISELTTENCLKALNNEEIDLAILATKESKDLYFQEFIFDEKMLLFINQNHPLAKKKTVSVDDLEACDMWLLEEGHCLRDDIIKICHLRRVENKRPMGLDIKIGNLESLRYLVQENFGYTLIPELATLKIPTVEKKFLKNFSKPEPKRSIYFTTRRKFLRKAAIDALKEQIGKSVSQKI